nr:MAG: putative RNA-dependent RNA polymerase [Trichoderma gamsii alphapartitivirus 1]
MQNNEVIGQLKHLGAKIHGTSSINPHYARVVDHALAKFLTLEEFDIVVHKHRRSAWNSDALQKDIDKLNSTEHSVIKDEHYWKAIQHVSKLFKPKEKLKPVHFADLRHYPWELSTNIGAPFNTSKSWQSYVKQKFDKNYILDEKYKVTFTDFEHRRDLFAESHNMQSLNPMVDARMTKRNLYTEMFMINREHIHRIKRGSHTSRTGHDLRYWHTAFARQHLVKDEEPDKVRLVFGAPSLLLMAELMFIWPIQASLLSRGEESPMLWGFETLLGGWQRIYSWAHRLMLSFSSVALLDWSGFDRYARHTVINDIHTHIMRPMFTFEDGYWPTHDYPDTTADPQHLENLWKWMNNAILSTPLMLEDGTLLRFRHSGIYSGYFQTQIIDSIYNSVMISTILSKMGFDLNKVHMKVQGDDSLILFVYMFLSLIAMSFLKTFSYFAQLYFGAVLSEKKSELLPSLENAEVLKYRNRNAMPYRNELELLAMLRHPERTSSYESLMARAIGIAYADCGSHPRVYSICEDIYKYLAALGITPDPKGLPGGQRFRSRYVPGEWDIDLSHFPTWYETVRHLCDPARPLLTEKHWPRKHFIGTP